ncbi:MAG: phosphatase PAP2 family protein [Candidatus Woykebacteria bacterium]
MLKRAALLISYITEPFLTASLALLLVFIKVDTDFSDKFLWSALGLIIGGAPAVAVFLYEKRKGKITDWFITNREQRRDVHLAWLIGSVVLSLIYLYIDVPRLLLATTLSLTSLAALASLATIYWKISIHIMAASFLVLTLLLVYSSAFLPVFFLIPLIGWCRIYLGHHTLSQVSIAAILAIFVVYYIFNLFGLATF